MMKRDDGGFGQMEVNPVKPTTGELQSGGSCHPSRSTNQKSFRLRRTAASVPTPRGWTLDQVYSPPYEYCIRN